MMAISNMLLWPKGWFHQKKKHICLMVKRSSIQSPHIIPSGASHTLGCYSLITDLCPNAIQYCFKWSKPIILPRMISPVRKSCPYPDIGQTDLYPRGSVKGVQRHLILPADHSSTLNSIFIPLAFYTTDFVSWICPSLKNAGEPISCDWCCLHSPEPSDKPTAYLPTILLFVSITFLMGFTCT